MNRLVSGNLWSEIERLAKKSKVKRAAIAYVTSDDVLKFGENDVLIVDASDHAIASGQTSVVVLKRALRHGAQLYSCSGLHAKVIVFDGVAVVGSANASRSSVEHKIEAALIS